MRIQVVCPHFAPDIAATGTMMTGIVTGLAAAGHEVHVVTALPFYRTNAVEPEWRGRWVQHEDVAWGRITRIQPFPARDKRSLVQRALGFGAFTALSSAAAILDRWRPDVVIAMAPPITLGLTGWLAARRHRVPYVFNVQDVFPDVTIELGLLTNRHLIRFFEVLERFTYRRADVVTTLTDDMRTNLLSKLGPDWAERVRVIPNFVDAEAIRPGPKDNDYRRDFGLEGKKVVMYTGNVGFSQPLGLLVGAARALANRSDVAFVISGDGAARPQLEAEAADLPNVQFVDYQPSERMSEVYAAADVHVVPLRSGLSRCSVPSKFYAILAAARPVVVSVDPGSELDRVIRAQRVGLSVDPDDPAGFTDAITTLLDDPAAGQVMGERGRAWIESWSSTTEIGDRYSQLLKEL
ncbi:MAG: glycosyltransferase family 4 protein [Acidimicrobiales bacterium]|nr:glycosyltransferase family 4 protein [Acidimicrobiales bacterium]